MSKRTYKRTLILALPLGLMLIAGGANATSFGIQWNGADVYRYDFDLTNGFTNQTLIQTGSPGTPFEGGVDGRDNHLACASATSCVIFTGFGSGTDFYTADLNLNTGFSNIQLQSWSRPSAFEDSAANTSPNADDNIFSFVSATKAVLFTGVSVFTYDFDLVNGFTNQQNIQGVPSGFEGLPDGEDNSLAFLDPTTAIMYRGDAVFQYDFDLATGFSNPVSIQGVPGGFEAGAFGRDNMLEIVSVPEPGTLLLLGSGLAGLAVMGRRDRRRG